MEKLIVVLSGPSGAGKGSIYQSISSKLQNTTKYVSMTTRQRRVNEVDGFDYKFVSEEEFKEKEKNGYFLETNFFDGNYYGTPNISSNVREGKDIFFDLNAEGGLKIKKEFPDAILFYILPQNLEQLKRQLGNRGRQRLVLAKQEIPIAIKYDWLIINKNVDEAADEIIEIMNIIRKSRMQNTANQDFVKKFY